MLAAVGLLYVSNRCHRLAQWLVPELNLSATDVSFRQDTLWWFLPNTWAVVLVEESLPMYVVDLIRTPYFVVAKYRKHGKDAILVLSADHETIHAMRGRDEEGYAGRTTVSRQSPTTEKTTWN